MRKQLFYKNLLNLLIPLLVTILIMGVGFIVFARHYTIKEINRNSMNLLNQAMANVELALNEMDTLNISIGHSSKAVNIMKEILNDDYLQYNSLANLDLIRSFIEAPSVSRPFIHSIYVYYKNPHNRFFSTDQGITHMDQYYDSSWLNALDEENSGYTSVQIRNIQRYGFERPQQIVTVYRKLESSGNIDGLIVMNIKASYLASLFNDLKMSDKQMVIIADENQNLIFNNSGNLSLENADLTSIMNQSEDHVSVTVGGKKYMYSRVKSEQYGWEYTSIIPESELYKLPILVTKYTLLVILIALIFGLTYAYVLTRRNTDSIMNIVHLLDSPEEPLRKPKHTSKVHDAYGYIIQRIIKNFIEQRYLNIQLSERKYKLKVMELQALQAQITPHFLYNTLETINWKMIGLLNGPNEVSRMIKNLSDILNYSLSNHNQFIAVEEEVHYCKAYMQIQQVRYREKFKVDWQISPMIGSVQILRMLVQPLMENSIYHGIKEKDGYCGIRVTIRAVGDKLEITVLDSGMGMTRARLLEIRSLLMLDNEISKHIGLLNTWRRVKLVYHKHADIRVWSKYGYGTKVSMRIPLRVDQEEMAE